MGNRLKRCGLPLLAATGIFPLASLLAFGNGYPLMLLWTAGYLLAGCICVQLPGKGRLAAAAGAALAMAALGLMFVLRTGEPLFLLTALAHGALLLSVLPGRENVRQAVVYSGLLLHTVVQLLLNLAENTAFAQNYAPVRPWLTVDLVVFLVLSLLTLNHISLSSALPDTQAVPGAIRRRNKLVTLLMLAATLLAALIPALGQWLSRGWEMLRKAVGQVIRWLVSLMPEKGAVRSGEAMGEMGFGGLGEEAAAGNFALWMEKILLGLAAVMAAALLLLALRFLWKKLKQLLRWLFLRLQTYAASASEDYADELQNTRAQGEEKFSPVRQHRRRLSAREMEALPPRERIRRRYALVRSRHPEWPSSHTARETLRPEDAALYERARYSDHPITTEDARRFTP